MTTIVTPDAMVTDAELAALVGVSARRIRQLAETGTLERAERGRYELGPSLRAMLEEAAGSGSALVRERTRKLSAEADRTELELARARGEVAPVDDMKRAMTNMCAIIQINMRAIPQRVVTQILGETNETVLKQKLRAEIDSALTQAAAPENFTQESLANEHDEDEA